MPEELVRGSAPPPKRPQIDVIRVTTTEPHQLICLSRQIFGQMVHWHAKRSHECVARLGTCQGCDENWPVKWEGYLHVSTAGASWHGFLEITQTAWEMLKQQAHSGKDLRGMMFRVSKTKGGKQGRYIISVLERRIEEIELLKELDPYPTLQMLWRVKKQPSPV